MGYQGLAGAKCTGQYRDHRTNDLVDSRLGSTIPDLGTEVEGEKRK